jgi:hypothetical protein
MFLLIYFFSINLFGDEQLLTDQILTSNKDLFIEIPEMKTRQETCTKLIKEGPLVIDLPTCILKGSGDGQLPPLTAEQITNLSEKLKSKLGPQFEGKELYTAEQKYDSAVKKLGDYYFQKLNETLYGKQDKDDPLAWSKKRYVEHSTFYEIYKNQVSKNLIDALSSYCIEADPEQSFIISIKREEREKIRKKNIDNLEIIFGEGEKAKSLAFKDWETCMQGIQHVCYKTAYLNQKKELVADYSSKLEGSKADWDYSNKRACLVMNYLKNTRQTILKVTEIQKLMNYVDGDSDKRIDWFKDIAGLDLFSETKTPIDSITGITSSDFKKSEMEKENLVLVEKLKDKCITNRDAKECQKLIFQNEDKSYNLAAEIALRTTAMLDKIEKMSDEELKVYLQEQGYPQEKIQELAKYKNELKKEIIDRYKADQQALIDELGQRIEAKSLEKITPEEQKEKIDKILEELTARPLEFKQLIHFSNMISGYLTVSSDGKKSKNFQSIFRELGDIESSTDNKDREEERRIKELKKSLTEHSIFAIDDKKEVEGVTVEALNKAVLKYQVEKMAEKPIEGWDEKDAEKFQSL